MSLDVTYQGPPTDGIDFSNAFQTMQYQISQNAAIQRAIQEVAQQANDPKYIRLHGGKMLDDLAKAADPWSGVLWACDNTLAEARREAAKRGMRVCDGSRDTPDMRHKFLRGAGDGENAGGTGGADTHDHTGVTHTHGFAGAVDGPGSGDIYCVVQCSSGVEVRKASFNSTFSGTTAAVDGAGGSASTLPSYYEVIWVRKT